MEEDIKNMSKEELLEYLEDISQQLDNIALDQIQFAISELQFFKEEYKKLGEKIRNYKLGDIIQEFEELFGNVPIDDIEKIKKYIFQNYIPTSVIQNILKEIDNRNYNDYTNNQDGNEVKNNILKDIQELLEERIK